MVARAEIILKHRPLVACYAMKYHKAGKSRGIELDDLISAGWVGFINGLIRWDDKRGVSAGAYLALWVKGAIHKLVCGRSTDRWSRLISLDARIANIGEKGINRPRGIDWPEPDQVDFRDWLNSLPVASRITARMLAEGSKPGKIRHKLGKIRHKLGLNASQFSALLANLRFHWGA
jgi:hypothetical protein